MPRPMVLGRIHRKVRYHASESASRYGTHSTCDSPENDYGDPSAKLWSVYLSVADNFDRAMAENWKGDMDGILIFTGLFSASVSAFVIESYKGLQPDPTFLLLAQISQQLSGGLNTSAQLPEQTPFKVPNPLLRVNIFWFLSLVFSVSCALGAILVQQWSRRYLRMTQHPAAPYRRARVRAYLYNGVERFHLAQVVEGIPVLLHASVFLFFAGLVQFLFTVNSAVAYFILGAVALGACAYMLFTVLPMVSMDSPFATPLSVPLWLASKAFVLPVLLIISSTSCCLTSFPRRKRTLASFVRRYRSRLAGSITHGLARALTRDQDLRALTWLSQSLYDDTELGPLVEGIPGFLKSPRIRSAPTTLWRLLREQSLGRRIGTLLLLCTDANGLPAATRTHRALTCMHAVWEITAAFRRERLQYAHLDGSLKIVAALKLLRADPRPEIALAATCTALLRVPVLLADCHRLVFRDLDEADRVWTWMPQAVRVACRDRHAMLRDGALVALADLAESVLPALGAVSEGHLVVVWDTLAVLAEDLLGHAPASAGAQRRFVAVLRRAVEARDAERVQAGEAQAQAVHLYDQPPYEHIARMLFRVAARLTDERAVADVAELLDAPSQSIQDLVRLPEAALTRVQSNASSMPSGPSSPILGDVLVAPPQLYLRRLNDFTDRSHIST
ncbi:hypothetical protein BV25DRAFT_311492 [Artomyces pyxidatus]|uniref:Uncharacterized protein n=1 Tax=Artomyces pyxidatus TaxID=48021 RepID=A0ACB8T659_9AGAM|nr:hypothetical protein BV25DRAFT_311492 [Artomyces pyxidatus]